MVIVLDCSEVDRGFDSRSDQTKDYEMCFCCFFDNHSALNSQSNDWMDWNQNDVSEWSDMSTRRLSFQ
jgi:hypothetical protein